MENLNNEKGRKALRIERSRPNVKKPVGSPMLRVDNVSSELQSWGGGGNEDDWMVGRRVFSRCGHGALEHSIGRRVPSQYQFQKAFQL